MVIVPHNSPTRYNLDIISCFYCKKTLLIHVDENNYYLFLTNNFYIHPKIPKSLPLIYPPSPGHSVKLREQAVFPQSKIFLSHDVREKVRNLVVFTISSFNLSSNPLARSKSVSTSSWKLFSSSSDWPILSGSTLNFFLQCCEFFPFVSLQKMLTPRVSPFLYLHLKIMIYIGIKT